MRAVVADALRAGAIGFSFDRSPSHRGDGGRRVPSVVASQDEVEALMMVTRDLGRGVIQCSPGEDFHWLYEFQSRLGRPDHVDLDPRVPSRQHGTRALGRQDRVPSRARCRAGSPRLSASHVPARHRHDQADQPRDVHDGPGVGRDDGHRANTVNDDAYADPAWRARAWAETDSGRYLDLRWSHFTVEESRSAPRCNGMSIEQLAP